MSVNTDVPVIGGGIIGSASARELARTEREEETLREVVADQRQHGLFRDSLEPDEARERHPWRPEIRGALFAPEDGAVDPVAVVDALIADGTRLGIRRIEDRITGLTAVGDRVTGAVGTERYSAGTVVLAAGACRGESPACPGRTPDGLPILGPEPRCHELWYATGHGRNVLNGGRQRARDEAWRPTAAMSWTRCRGYN